MATSASGCRQVSRRRRRKQICAAQQRMPAFVRTLLRTVPGQRSLEGVESASIALAPLWIAVSAHRRARVRARHVECTSMHVHARPHRIGAIGIQVATSASRAHRDRHRVQYALRRLSATCQDRPSSVTSQRTVRERRRTTTCCR
jgi:hypothetical protein